MNFGFISHLFLHSEAVNRGIHPDQIPCEISSIPTDQEIKEIIREKKIIKSKSTINVMTANGAQCKGKVFILPLTPTLIFNDQLHAIKTVALACDIAKEWGADIIGLGLINAKLGRRGVEIQNIVDPPLTTGDSYLIYCAYLALQKIIELYSIDVSREIITIYGFPSTVGEILTEKLVSMGLQVKLLVKKTKFILKFADKIKEQYSIDLILSEEINQNNRLLFTAGSGMQIFDINRLIPGTIVIDISFPRNIPVNTRPDDILVVDGGMITLPPDSVYPNPENEMNTKTVFSCIGESSILALSGRKESFSLGRNISLKKVNEIGSLGEQYNFYLDKLYSFGRPLDPEKIKKFSHMFLR